MNAPLRLARFRVLVTWDPGVQIQSRTVDVIARDALAAMREAELALAKHPSFSREKVVSVTVDHLGPVE